MIQCNVGRLRDLLDTFFVSNSILTHCLRVRALSVQVGVDVVIAMPEQSPDDDVYQFESISDHEKPVFLGFGFLKS